MINKNILSMFMSHLDNPSFSIVITDIKQEENCGQESICFTVHQIDKSLSELEENANITERTLTIRSELGVDERNLYKTKLLGYISNEEKITPDKPTSKIIEFLDTTLTNEVNVEFSNEYKEKPTILINIEKEYESFYKNTIIDYITEERLVDEDKVTYYTGANITFKGLKRKSYYPIINIIVSGEIKDED